MTLVEKFFFNAFFWFKTPNDLITIAITVYFPMEQSWHIWNAPEHANQDKVNTLTFPLSLTQSRQINDSRCPSRDAIMT